MIAVDVNILIYAHRQDQEHHEFFREYLESTISAGDALGPRHWQLTSELCRQCGCTGKLVADAQHAAIAVENACTWVTRDRDYEVFTRHGLRLQLLEP